MLSQCGIHMGLSGGITSVTLLTLPFGLLRASIPLFPLEDKEVICPVHFMLNQDELFLPAIALGFCAKPMNTVDYKRRRNVISGIIIISYVAATHIQSSSHCWRSLPEYLVTR